MKYCPNCKKIVDTEAITGADFCTICGKRLGVAF